MKSKVFFSPSKFKAIGVTIVKKHENNVSPNSCFDGRDSTNGFFAVRTFIMIISSVIKHVTNQAVWKHADLAGEL